MSEIERCVSRQLQSKARSHNNKETEAIREKKIKQQFRGFRGCRASAILYFWKKKLLLINQTQNRVQLVFPYTKKRNIRWEETQRRLTMNTTLKILLDEGLYKLGLFSATYMHKHWNLIQANWVRGSFCARQHGLKKNGKYWAYKVTKVI